MTCPKCGQRIAVTNTEERENGIVMRRRQCRNRKCRLVIKTREAIQPDTKQDVINL
jgi:hypothetical protein